MTFKTDLGPAYADDPLSRFPMCPIPQSAGLRAIPTFFLNFAHPGSLDISKAYMNDAPGSWSNDITRTLLEISQRPTPWSQVLAPDVRE